MQTVFRFNSRGNYMLLHQRTNSVDGYNIIEIMLYEHCAKSGRDTATYINVAASVLCTPLVYLFFVNTFCEFGAVYMFNAPALCI